ncbi:Arsenical resistance operon repressor [hydrothermal vent metagenome]|uniref:Arsenical resistance operon repressor n=1 Tax=hydrothermal vent metagenome TaxID=652676 RepID=A0A3B1BYD1_9ZZZZ
MNMDENVFFATLANDVRLRTLMLLQGQGELCVCELTHALGLSQPKISRHLALLRESGLLLTRREGTWMYYRINLKLPVWMQNNLQTTFEGIRRSKVFVVDKKRLKSMSSRPEAVC